ncbi:MAG TPA: alkaline phosphatase family protein, partial [Bryobacteraceae bacterium]|nr:alkaline phosphatase family protein [Bryobacteraceae bacterium]
YWAKAAGFLIEKHKPNLLLYHLLNLDATHHRYGPKTPAGYTGIAYADDRIKELLDSLRKVGVLDRTTLLIVSDHGFKNVRHQIRANVLLREQGLVRREGGKLTCDAWVVPEGGSALVYVTDPSKKRELAPRLRQLFSGVKGVSRVLGPKEFPALGLPLPEKSDQAPDLVLAAAEGYTFAGGEEGSAAQDIAEGGSHGYLNSDPDMQEVFVAWGYGIRKGARLDLFDNIDVAPTVARLLGVSMSGIDGQVLSRALQ